MVFQWFLHSNLEWTLIKIHYCYSLQECCKTYAKTTTVNVSKLHKLPNFFVCFAWWKNYIYIYIHTVILDVLLVTNIQLTILSFYAFRTQPLILEQFSNNSRNILLKWCLIHLCANSNPALLPHYCLESHHNVYNPKFCISPHFIAIKVASICTVCQLSINPHWFPPNKKKNHKEISIGPFSYHS